MNSRENFCVLLDFEMLWVVVSHFHHLLGSPPVLANAILKVRQFDEREVTAFEFTTINKLTRSYIEMAGVSTPTFEQNEAPKR